MARGSVSGRVPDASPAPRVRRSMLYAPADREDRARKCLASTADSAVLDLEDAVAPDRKDEAREVARLVLASAPAAGRRAERCVRVNAARSPWHEKDLDMVVAARPDAVVLPKAEDPADVVRVATRLTEAHVEASILCICETALGVLNAYAIACANARVDALVFGAEDYAADTGARRSPSNREVWMARSTVVMAAAARRIAAIDQVFVDYKDLDGLARDATEGRDLGYRGKQVIHPQQIEVVNAVFTPTPEAVERARRIVEADAKHAGAVFSLDGRMIDRPLVEQARYVLRVAEANR